MEDRKDFEAYSIGLVCASVCSSLSVKETIKRMNFTHPTGISSQWKLSKDKEFATGQTNPCPCKDSPGTHKHYLLNC